jgi:hypothetical protein
MKYGIHPMQQQKHKKADQLLIENLCKLNSHIKLGLNRSFLMIYGPGQSLRVGLIEETHTVQ